MNTNNFFLSFIQPCTEVTKNCKLNDFINVLWTQHTKKHFVLFHFSNYFSEDACVNKCGGNLQLIQCSVSAAAWMVNRTRGGKLAGSRQGWALWVDAMKLKPLIIKFRHNPKTKMYTHNGNVYHSTHGNKFQVHMSD